jgi:23S rRNA (uracil1939-C5)-methyltransferase
MSYEEELRFKLQRVNDALRHIGKQQLQASEIIGSDEITRYRNKGIFAVGKVDSKAAYGFFRERSHDLIAVDSCLIQNELTERCARVVTEFINSHGIAPYDEATGRGTVRHVFCRRAIHTGDAVVCIVSARGFGSSTEALVKALREACPELSGIVLNINKVKGNTVLSGDFFTLWGKTEICDTLCGLSFNIAPQAFYQINPAQAERLYNRALEYACPQPVKLAFDLYCGAGTISLCLARQAEKVIGAEIVPEAIENAKHNAAANGIANAEFICADAGQAAELLAKRGLRPEVIVVDPPRKGMDENAVAAVASMEPERIVYVSCNPATLARDVLRFNALGYELKAATAVDMFPRTGHVECVGLLSRRS